MTDHGEDRSSPPQTLGYATRHGRPDGDPAVAGINLLFGAICGVVLGLPAAFVALFAAGGGHGVYWPAKVLFPYSMLATAVTGSITTPLVLLALVQFPLYGLALGWIAARRVAGRGALALAALHAVAAVAAFAFADQAFAR